jgi:hypothetical protein
VPFIESNGNVQRYVQKRQVAVCVVATVPHNTLLYELVQIELGNTTESEFTDSKHMLQGIREVLKAITMLWCESLELLESEYCRGYLQSQLCRDVIAEKSLMNIFHAVDLITEITRLLKSNPEKGVGWE